LLPDSPDTLFESRLHSLPLHHRGKVRDIYRVDERHLLIVTTDRLSAFDVVLPTPIPGKGQVLTALSSFWFERMQHIVPNHLQLAEHTLADILPDAKERAAVAGRAMVVRRLRALPIEAIVRGYLAGSAWKDYQHTGAVCGIDLPAGLRLADQLEAPLYTPSSKAAVGEHDQNISYQDTEALLGPDLAAQLRDTVLRIYGQASSYAASRGIIIADTKFELGVDESGTLVLIDEALTPDSSRFWPAESWRPGESPPSFDKQFVRDYLETLDWDKRPPAPPLPAPVVARTASKYREAQARLMRA
jgi:phosphoribosylaminoimidazole-succinocarboxamide synthase